MVRAKKSNVLPNSLAFEDDQAKELPLNHVAIIMDGNRRWADAKRLPKLAGHQEGVKALKRLVKHVSQRGLKYLTVYAFSSENWQRGQEEVAYLLELFTQVLRKELKELTRNNVCLSFIGDLSGMPYDLQRGLFKAMEDTRDNTGLSLQVALNYGSRLEIVEAVKQIAREVIAGTISVNHINADLVGSYLYTKNIPDPDLMIRTGGEMRLSNYLLWQAAYTELYVTSVLWPEFSEEEFDKAITSYSRRQRRYGAD